MCILRAKMHGKLILVILGCFSIVPLLANEQFCGLKAPKKDSTCVEIKLPWQKEAVYFCKDDHFYRPCPWNVTCWNRHTQTNNVMEINAPWMCCKQSSYPNICEIRKCDAAPFNRTCIAKKRYATSCCSSYFCGNSANMDRWPKCANVTCDTPPKDEKCISFYDRHDCCPKVQCPKDEKKGSCPELKDGEYIPKWVRTAFKSRSMYKSLQRCTGDQTCQGAEKCCIGYKLTSRVIGYCYEVPHEDGNDVQGGDLGGSDLNV